MVGSADLGVTVTSTTGTAGEGSDGILVLFSFILFSPGWFPAKFVEVLDERSKEVCEFTAVLHHCAEMQVAVVSNDLKPVALLAESQISQDVCGRLMAGCILEADYQNPAAPLFLHFMMLGTLCDWS